MEETLNQEHWDRLRKAFHKDADLDFEDLVQILLTSAEEKVDQVNRAIADGNREKTIEIAHFLKGSSGDLGATKLIELSSALEALAEQEGEDQELRRVTGDIRLELRKVREMLEA